MSLRAILPPLPGPWRGLRIGLFGGSFNPAHEGHLHVAETARQRLGLDWVWWLPANGNPLKDQRDDYPARYASARRMAAGHPGMLVTPIERALGTRYTRDTLARLLPRLAGAHPVWIIGGDSLASFHLWGGWREIADSIPIAVVARHANAARALNSPFARRYAASRIREEDAARLAFMAPPAWVYLAAPINPASSTERRRARTARNPFRRGTAP